MATETMTTATSAPVSDTAVPIIHLQPEVPTVLQRSPIKQKWWTNERLAEKVTHDFIANKLKPQNRAQLTQPMAFGDDLTDLTYLEWTLTRAQRFFLILADIGAADQIFSVLDSGWDDSELPVPWADIETLALTGKSDESANRRFHAAQSQYLYRPLTFEAHISYIKDEQIPLIQMQRLPTAATLQNWYRMQIPGRSNETFVRRKFNLGTGTTLDAALEAQFKADVYKAQLVRHRHIADAWASHTFKSSGYILSSFNSEHTLKSLVEARNVPALQKLSKSERSTLSLSWLHCLADALATMHYAGQQHTAISPSNIVIDGQNRIAFSDIGSLKTFQMDKKTDVTEIYNYGAPETYGTNCLPFLSTSPDMLRYDSSRFQRHNRSMNSSISSSISQQSTCSSIYSSTSSLSTSPPGSQTPAAASMSSIDLFSGAQEGSPPPPCRPPPPLPKDEVYIRQATNCADSKSIFNEPQCSFSGMTVEVPAYLKPEQADIFSLGCIFLDILTYVIKDKVSDFTKFRTTKRKLDSPYSSYAAQVPQASGKTDSSFQYNLHKVLAWIDTLDSEATLANEPTYRAVPALLRLIRSMLVPTPALRPCAAEVRERIHAILTHDAAAAAAIPHLCCHTPTRAPPPKRAPPRLALVTAASPSAGGLLTAALSTAQFSASPTLSCSTSPGKAQQSRSPQSERGHHGGLGGLVRGFKWGSRKQSI